MQQVETIRTRYKIADSTITLPAIFYGENNVDAVITATFSDEQEVSWIVTLFTGYQYEYTMTITDE